MKGGVEEGLIDGFSVLDTTLLVSFGALNCLFCRLGDINADTAASEVVHD